MQIINLFAGPCSGKSTTAAGLFYKMKLQHINAELVTEYAKDLVYSNRIDSMLDQQEYIFAKQNHRLHRLRGKVDYVITDSPILLSLIYANPEWPCVQPFKQLVLQTHHTYDNINIFLQRPQQFQQHGRVHNLKQSEKIDEQILQCLQDNNIDYVVYPTDQYVVDSILKNQVHCVSTN